MNIPNPPSQQVLWKGKDLKSKSFCYWWNKPFPEGKLRRWSTKVGHWARSTELKGRPIKEQPVGDGDNGFWIMILRWFLDSLGKRFSWGSQRNGLLPFPCRQVKSVQHIAGWNIFFQLLNPESGTQCNGDFLSVRGKKSPLQTENDKPRTVALNV